MQLELKDVVGDITISIQEGNLQRHLNPEIKQRVDDIWLTESQKAEKLLFNGFVFSIHHCEDFHIFGEYIEYKYFVAQKRDSDVAKLLNICPLSISGFTHYRGKWLIGKRSHSVMQYPDFYEFVPSGSIDKVSQVGNYVDYRKQVLLELQEETGIEDFMVKNIKPVSLAFENSSQRHCEICVIINLDEEKKLAKLRFPSEEYQEMKWYSEKELMDFIHTHSDSFVPLSVRFATGIRLNRDTQDND